MSQLNPKVDHYLDVGCGRCPLGNTPQCKVHKWRETLETLRSIVLDCGLTETVKWGVPCYMFQQSNLILLGAFNDYCALSFFKGALLKDPERILSKPGEHTQSARLIRFKNVQEIIALENTLKAYIFEAIENEKVGLKVAFAKHPEPIPEELQQKMDEMPVFEAAFKALSPGRQRGYILYFSAPKQAQTRVSRIEKYQEQILQGKGLND